MTDTQILLDKEEVIDTGEPIVAHVVMKKDQMRGYVAGEPIEALCGVIWVPSRDFTQYPVCQKCEEIKKQILSARQGSN